MAPWRRVAHALLVYALCFGAGAGVTSSELAAQGQGDLRLAADLLERAVQRFTHTAGERDAETLTAMNSLALVYGALGRTAESMALNEKVLRLRREILGERHPDTLQSMNNLASNLGALGRTAEQLALRETVLQLHTEALGERHPNTLIAMGNLAVAYFARGRTEEALTLNERVARLRTDTQGERHPDALRALSNLAATLGALGRTAEQLALNERVLRLRAETLGERHPDTLISMNNLAATYSELGRSAEQLALTDKVLRLRIEVLGEGHPDTVLAMANHASSYGAMGRGAEQLALNEKVFERFTAIHGDRHPDTLKAMGNLAIAYGKLGRKAEEWALLEKLVQLRTEALGERHPDTLHTLHSLVVGLGARGRIAEQRTLAEKVLRLRLEILGVRHPDTLRSMTTLARAYSALGFGRQALALLERVLRTRTETLGLSHPDTLEAMNNLGSAYRESGQVADGLVLHEEALRQAREILGERHPNTLTAISNTAWSYFLARRPADAAKLSSGYVAGAEWQRGQPGLSGEYRRSLFEGLASGYRLFGLAHGTVGQGAEGFRLAELGKARTLLEAMVAQRAGRSGVLPEADQARLDELNRQAAALDQRLLQAGGAPARGPLEVRRNELVRQYEALQTELRARHPKYAQLGDVRILAAPELPGLLGADTLAVSYVHLPARGELGAYLVGADGLHRFVPLGSVPFLGDAVEIVRLGQSIPAPLSGVLASVGKRAWRVADGSYRLLPADRKAPAEAGEVQDWREVARFLAKVLLQPLAPDLAGKPRWLISPDGPLAQLPFETLPFGEEGAPALQAAEIHYTQSLSVFALGRELQRQYASLDQRRSLFAMGNPHYKASASGPLPRGSARSRVLSRGQRLSDLDPLWEPLPGTEAEVRAVAALFPDSALVQLGPEATEQNLQALNGRGELRNFRHLLFSAHGYLSPDEPALSAIVLGLQNKTPEADGYLTAAEWPGYDLRSDLTVLSACDSGMGQLVNGEGVMGLPFALFVAGNVNTILTLWPVDDEATAEFVRQLFERVQRGLSASRALTETKRAFRNHPRFSAPSYWAPFILVGAG